MAGYKLSRISEDVKRVLSAVFSERKIEGLPDFISITDVIITSDLKYAKIYVSILGDEKTASESVKILNENKKYYRHEISMRVKIRNTPEITFYLDDSIAYGAKISKIIGDIMNNGEKNDDK